MINVPVPFSVAAATVRRWWRSRKWLPDRNIPFEVVCPCGGVARGYRQASYQVVICPGCRQPLFVLPQSPLPPVSPVLQPRRWGHVHFFRSRRWQLALLTAGFAFLACLSIFSVFLIRRSTGKHPATPETIRRHIQAGKDALAQGRFHLASQEVAAALQLQQHDPTILSVAERRRLLQLDRQATLLADLLSESLQDIVRQAAELGNPDGGEWQANFAKRYQGKALVFDTVVRRGASQPYQIDWWVFVHDRQVTIDLGELHVLRRLPLERPQRLVFGARLASVRLEPGGTWVVHFQPDSGVLMTDPGALTACRLGQPPDPDLLEVLRRQKAWLAEMP